MLSVFHQVSPLILLFFIGVALRRTGLVTANDASIIIKIVFYVALPGMVLQSLTHAQITPDFFYLPLIAVSTILFNYGVGILLNRILQLPAPKLGVFLIGGMIINIGFVIPFIMAGFGNEGIARLSMYDLGNGLLTFSFTYYLAFRYGSGAGNKKAIALKFVTTPAIWALLSGIILNINQIHLPPFLDTLSLHASQMTVPLMMISIGLFFRPQKHNFSLASLIMAVRMLGGLLVGLFFSEILNLQGLTRTVVLFASLAPVGFNTLTFATLEELDIQLAASVVSYGIIAGLLVQTALLFVWG